MKRSSIAVLVLFVLACVAQAAEPTKVVAYVHVTGQKSGVWKGEVIQKPVEGTIPAYAVNFEAVSPRDAATGLPTGRRQYRPLVIVTDMNRTSPLFFNALATNENLTQVKIDFYHPDTRVGTAGAMVLYQTITLTNANVSDVHWHTGTGEGGNTASSGRQYEDVSFTFQKITIQNYEGNTAATDDWSART